MTTSLLKCIVFLLAKPLYKNLITLQNESCIRFCTCPTGCLRFCVNFINRVDSPLKNGLNDFLFIKIFSVIFLNGLIKDAKGSFRVVPFYVRFNLFFSFFYNCERTKVFVAEEKIFKIYSPNTFKPINRSKWFLLGWAVVQNCHTIVRVWQLRDLEVRDYNFFVCVHNSRGGHNVELIPLVGLNVTIV